jgi:hypothetical protein
MLCCASKPQKLAAGYEGAVSRLVTILSRMRAREVGDDYTYYGIASPWLQVQDGF